MGKTADAHYKKEKKNDDEIDFDSEYGFAVDDVFSLPAFERFAKVYENGQVIISEFQNGDSFYFIQKWWKYS